MQTRKQALQYLAESAFGTASPAIYSSPKRYSAACISPGQELWHHRRPASLSSTCAASAARLLSISLQDARTEMQRPMPGWLKQKRRSLVGSATR
jgi:hypothetical protein